MACIHERQNNADLICWSDTDLIKHIECDQSVMNPFFIHNYEIQCSWYSTVLLFSQGRSTTRGFILIAQREVQSGRSWVLGLCARFKRTCCFCSCRCSSAKYKRV